MLSAVEARGLAAAAAAANALRQRVADVLRDTLPGVEVLVQDEKIYLSGQLSVDDARLRWIGSLLL